MTIQAGWGNTKTALLELADVGVDNNTRDSVLQAVTHALESIDAAPEQVYVRCVQGVKAGQYYLMDVELGVPGSWTVERTRGVENLVRVYVRARVWGVNKLCVRFVVSSESKSNFLDKVSSDLPSGRIGSEADSQHDHDHDHDHKHSQSTDESAWRWK